MRFLFILLLLAHGLIHLMGFAKAFQYAAISQLRQPISQASGVLWLLAALLFVAAAAMFLWRKDSWWMAAAPAAVISQWLIFSSWQDAKFGTLINLIVLIVGVVAYGRWSFEKMVRSELNTFLSAPMPERTFVTRDMLDPLPLPVQKWLERSGAVGREMTRSVHLKQTGEMKTSPGGKWLPFTAEQYCRLDQPGFIWKTEIQAGPLMSMIGRDKYENGYGHMYIKFLSLIPVADAKGPETDQGTMLRYLAETCWYPSAALRDYVRWEPVDSLSAKATMTYGGISASGIFRFNPEGDLTGFEAKRYYARKEGASLEDWRIATNDWKEFDGLRIPYKSEVAWKLKTGDFTWLRLEITELQCD